jgi:hypothetical protein
LTTHFASVDLPDAGRPKNQSVCPFIFVFIANSCSGDLCS